MHEAGGVEQDIGRACAFCDGRNRSAVAGVELCDFRDAFALEISELCLVDVGGKHGGALARKGQRTGAADAGGGCGDEGALALQAV